MKLRLNSQLFKIETNDNFGLKKIKKNKLFDKVLSNFNVSKNYKIFAKILQIFCKSIPTNFFDM